MHGRTSMRYLNAEKMTVRTTEREQNKTLIAEPKERWKSEGMYRMVSALDLQAAAVSRRADFFTQAVKQPYFLA